jgi:heme-binding protein
VRRRTTILIGVCAAAFVAIQLVHANRTNPPVRSDLAAPQDVGRLIRRACFDCHSNETRWLWYSAVAPFSWVIARDVSAGRRRLNFSDWADYASDPETKKHKLQEIVESIARGDMAPWYYRVLHPEARLRLDERDLVIHWASREATTASPSANSLRGD